MTFASPQLPDGEAYGLRIRLSGRLGDHALIIEHEVGTAPNVQPHAGADPECVCHVVLADSVDAGFAPDVIMGIGAEPESIA